MKVQLIAQTSFEPPIDVPWQPDNAGEIGNNLWSGQQLAEFAGRACYQSWTRPNPATATNRGYLAHILEIGHESVLEHASATFYITGVSRSLTHELVRHRHLSYSQLSQRYVDESETEFVVPPLLRDSLLASDTFRTATAYAQRYYQELVSGLTEEFPEATRKEIRQAARAVLPNATESKIVVTGNYRAWRHFITLRATEAADVEIRGLAVEILGQLTDIAPNVFQDFVLQELKDGTWSAMKR